MNTEKKLSDYLHFYLGQKVRWHYVDYDKDTWTIWETLTPRILAVKLDDHSVDKIQMQARRLSSITDDEIKDLFEYDKLLSMYKNVSFEREMALDIMTGITLNYSIEEEETGALHAQSYTIRPSAMNAYDFAWFIKKGFWLFGMDWFTEGLIIDADTI